MLTYLAQWYNNLLSTVDMRKHLLKLNILLIILPFITFLNLSCSADSRVDVLVIGGGASGVAAGIQAARMGSNTLIVEETPWLGGMLTAAGVSATDGNYRMRGGIWGEFIDSLVTHYGSLDSLRTGWVSKILFEPSVGNSIFQHIVAKEKNLTVYNKGKLTNLKKVNNEWHADIQYANTTKKVIAKILIDATELGDVAKMCGVDYHIGMDSRERTGEIIVPEVANNIIQDLTYVAILKDYGENKYPTKDVRTVRNN